MKFSKFIHIKKVDQNVFALLHSVSMQLFFTTIQENVLYSLFIPKDESTIENILLDSGDESGIFFKRLIENKFLVDDNYDENKIIQKIFNLNSGEIRIENAYFFLTDSCNLNCEYCLVKKPEHKKFNNKSMSFLQAKKIY